MNRNSNPMNSNISRRSFAVGVAAVGLIGVSRYSAVAEDGASGSSGNAEHPLVPALRHARTSIENVEKLTSYECVFTKKEVVGRQTISQTMKM